MSEKRFKLDVRMDMPKLLIDNNTNEKYNLLMVNDIEKIVDVLNEQQELIEELEVSDEMGWKRAEYFEKKCPKELHNKKMYIKRLEYKVQKFKEENEELITERNLLLQKKDRYYRLYQLKDAEVTARVDTLNKVCNYYLTEAQFKAGTDPNEAVKEVLKEILNTEVEMW